MDTQSITVTNQTVSDSRNQVEVPFFNPHLLSVSQLHWLQRCRHIKRAAP
jgi:hypothetical protein